MIRLLLFFAFLANGQDGSRWWRHVEFLADDKLEGRNTGSEGHRKGASYVAEQFERAGLKPAGIHGYIQPVKFKTRQIDESRSSVSLLRNGKSEALTLGEDVTIGLRTDPAAAIEAPLVFAGSGRSQFPLPIGWGAFRQSVPFGRRGNLRHSEPEIDGYSLVAVHPGPARPGYESGRCVPR